MIVQNQAGWGGGLNFGSSSGTFTNCTIADTTADARGGLQSDNSRLEALNCILWGNNQTLRFDPELRIEYSDVEGGYAGIGNIEADPLFVEPLVADYHLGESPCIDAGTFDGEPRPWRGGYDMGADENSSVGIASESPEGVVRRGRLQPPYPNPFNPEVFIPYELATHDPVELGIYDREGRRIRTLVEESQGAGQHGVRWDGTNQASEPLPSGVYTSRLHSPGWVAHRDVVIVK